MAAFSSVNHCQGQRHTPLSARVLRPSRSQLFSSVGKSTKRSTNPEHYVWIIYTISHVNCSCLINSNERTSESHLNSHIKLYQRSSIDRHEFRHFHGTRTSVTLTPLTVGCTKLRNPSWEAASHSAQPLHLTYLTSHYFGTDDTTDRKTRPVVAASLLSFNGAVSC